MLKTPGAGLSGLIWSDIDLDRSHRVYAPAVLRTVRQGAPVATVTNLPHAAPECAGDGSVYLQTWIRTNENTVKLLLNAGSRIIAGSNKRPDLLEIELSEYQPYTSS